LNFKVWKQFLELFKQKRNWKRIKRRMGQIRPMASALRAWWPAERGRAGLPRTQPAVITSYHAQAVARQVQAHQRPPRGKVYAWSASAEGWRCRSRRGPVGLTEDGGQRRGGASGFRRWCLMAAGEIWWPAVMAVWSCSLEVEGRGKAVP
jgi:hypothetical protein